MKRVHEWASVWVCVDVDFVECFPRLLHIELFCVVMLLARSAEPLWRQKQENKQNKNSECAAHFLPDFLAIIFYFILFIILPHTMNYKQNKTDNR